MTSQANSVNIKSPAARVGRRASDGPRGYHHGDLRDALINAGMAALDTAPVGELSLRALAREAGVSATAVYRHFPDKAALLTALALAALDRMGQDQRAAAAAVGTGARPEQAFCATGTAYVRFAIAHPQAFRLIWTALPRGDGLARTLDAGDSASGAPGAMALLRQSVSAILPPDAEPAERREMAARCWALVHGLAMLILDGQLQVDNAMLDRIVAGVMPSLRAGPASAA